MAERQKRKDAKVRPSLPDPLPRLDGPVGVVDNHTHLDHESDDATVTGLLLAANEVGVTHHVTIGCNLEAARWTVDAVQRHDRLLGGVSLHPNEAPRLAARGLLDEALAEIEELAQRDRIVVVGETGMDAYRTDHADTGAAAAQEESFRAHIALAKRLGKPMQIHDRDTHEEVLRILADAGAPDRTVFHCFSGDAQLARFCAEQGWYVSFAGVLTFRNAADLRAALHEVPLERVLVETDAPYLTPEPYRGRLNASYLVPLTVRAMADELDLPVETVSAHLSRNSVELYGPW